MRPRILFAFIIILAMLSTGYLVLAEDNETLEEESADDALLGEDIEADTVEPLVVDMQEFEDVLNTREVIIYEGEEIQAAFDLEKTYEDTPEEILLKLRAGDFEFMKRVVYEDMLEIIKILDKESRYRRHEEEGLYKNRFIRALMEVPTSPVIRNNLMRASFGGLHNLDPRIRLIFMKILRRLIPTIDMLEPASNMIDEETVVIDYYKFNSIDNKEYAENCFLELAKLNHFISRSVLVNQVLSGDTEVLQAISKEVFNLLYEQIDKEGFCRIPMNFFGYDELETLFNGLENPNDEVVQGILTALLRLVRTKNLNMEQRLYIYNRLVEKDFRDSIIVGATDEQLAEIPKDLIIKVFTLKNGEVEACYLEGETYVYNDRYDDPDSPYFNAPNLNTRPVRYGIEWTYRPEGEEPIEDTVVEPTPEPENGQEFIEDPVTPVQPTPTPTQEPIDEPEEHYPWERETEELIR